MQERGVRCQNLRLLHWRLIFLGILLPSRGTSATLIAKDANARFLHHPKPNVRKRIEAETNKLLKEGRNNNKKSHPSSQLRNWNSSNVAQNSPVPANSTYYKEPVLLFWAVSAQPRVMSLVVQNVGAVRKHLQHADVFLAHYDKKRNAWLENDVEWYDRNVKFSEERNGFKFQLMRELLVGGATEDFDLRRYTWVWALDEDVDFHSTNLPLMFSLADASGALLALPAFTESGATRRERELSYPLQQPKSGCRYRYSPVVEVIFPMFRSTVLTLLLEKCDHCIHQKSSWGLDRMWCSWAARNVGHDARKTCAILDETPVQHLNFKTLKGKYIKPGSGAISPTFQNTANVDLQDVSMHYPLDFVKGSAASIQSWECIRR